MLKTVAKKDEGSDKDAKIIQAQIKEIANLKAELKKGSELESKLKDANKKCKELEEELKKAKKPTVGEQIAEDKYSKPKSALKEEEGESSYNPHKKAIDNIFSYADQVHETKEKLRFLNYVIYVGETKLEEMYSSAFENWSFIK